MRKTVLHTLTRSGIEARYGTLVDHIVNRTNTGYCPMEEAVRGIDDPYSLMLVFWLPDPSDQQLRVCVLDTQKRSDLPFKGLGIGDIVCDLDIQLLPLLHGNEVDFLVTDRITKKRRLIQVAWEMSDSATKTRELSALKSARDEIKVKDCSVVTWDEEWEKDGIRIVPAWKWCLGESV